MFRAQKNLHVLLQGFGVHMTTYQKLHSVNCCSYRGPISGGVSEMKVLSSVVFPSNVEGQRGSHDTNFPNPGGLKDAL